MRLRIYKGTGDKDGRQVLRLATGMKALAMAIHRYGAEEDNAIGKA
jgi:hypothetical protein